MEPTISTPNPYEAPKQLIKEAFDTDKLLKKGFLTVIASTVFFGVMGCGVGGLLGVLVPDYYQTVFRFSAPYGEVWKIGAGLGLTQGLVAGIVVGCVVLLSTAWYKSRMNSSVAQMLAQLQALQATSPNMKPETTSQSEPMENENELND